MKKYLLRYLTFLLGVGFFFLYSFNSSHVQAQITRSGNTFTITTGEDLFNLLSNEGNYWKTQATPPDNWDLTISVNNTITLPAGIKTLLPQINAVTVNFNNHTFYAADSKGSTIQIPSSKSVQAKVENAIIRPTSGNDQISGVPTPNGTGTMTAYETTPYGFIFSSDNINDAGVKNTQTRLTLNNITYDASAPNRLRVPVNSFYIPIIFTGNNTFITSPQNESPFVTTGVTVESGTTNIDVGQTNQSLLSDAIFKPFRAHYDSDTFSLNVQPSASLNITNRDENASIFGSTSTVYNVKINNYGNLNINSLSEKNSLFGLNIKSGMLNTYAGSTTTIASNGPVVNRQQWVDPTSKSSLSTFLVDLGSYSKTALISRKSSVLKNVDDNGEPAPWTPKRNNSISVHPEAKLLTYGGSGADGGGLTNGFYAWIVFQPNLKTVFARGYSKAEAGIPTSPDSFDNKTSSHSQFVSGPSSWYWNDMKHIYDYGLLIYSTFQILDVDSGHYAWNYSLDQLPDQDQLLPRTSKTPIRFKILDTIDLQPIIHVDVAYHANESDQPFSVYFRRKNDTSLKLTDTPQTVIFDFDLNDNKDGTYSVDFDQNSGILIKSSKHAGPGTWTGVIDWTLVNDLK